MSYHQFQHEDGERHGSFEVFYVGALDGMGDVGWYWWACFPGCLPDGDASGPFLTASDAIADAEES